MVSKYYLLTEGLSPKTSILHSAKLAILDAFYQITNESVMGSTLMVEDEVKSIEPIEVSFFAETTDRLLFADTSASFSLRKSIHGRSWPCESISAAKF